jgi:ferritin-like protein
MKPSEKRGAKRRQAEHCALTLGDKLVTFSVAQNILREKIYLDGDPAKWRS